MRRLYPLVLIAAGLIVMLLAGGYWLFTRTVNIPGAVALPPQLADQSLGTAVFGQQAVTEIARLHGKGFPLSSGAMGFYGQDHQITLWVAGAPLDLLAKRMLVDMRDRVAQGNSPFLPVGERAYPDRIVYELEGMGQTHYYFRSEDLLVWLAADPELADQALTAALAFFP